MSRARLGEEQVNLAAIAKLWAERRAGELLALVVEHGGDRRSESSSRTTNLKDMGVTADQSSQWQKLAAVPAEAGQRSWWTTFAPWPNWSDEDWLMYELDLRQPPAPEAEGRDRHGAGV